MKLFFYPFRHSSKLSDTKPIGMLGCVAISKPRRPRNRLFRQIYPAYQLPQPRIIGGLFPPSKSPTLSPIRRHRKQSPQNGMYNALTTQYRSINGSPNTQFPRPHRINKPPLHPPHHPTRRFIDTRCLKSRPASGSTLKLKKPPTSTAPSFPTRTSTT